MLKQVSKMWVFVAYDVDTKEEFIFSDYDDEARPVSELWPFLANCRRLVGHNIVMYDMMVLLKLYGWRPNPQTKIVDTMILSQVLNYKRFGFGHSLGRWGEHLQHKKPAHEDWSQYSQEMKTRCVEDTHINVKVYKQLLRELSQRKEKDKLIAGLDAEHAASTFVAEANYHGWPFDYEKAVALHAEIGARMEEISSIITPKLKKRLTNFDNPRGTAKSPAWVKNGNYAARTYQWFEIDPESGRDELPPVWGDYCRVHLVEPDIGSLDSVREYLYSIGWEPDEWNYTKDRKTGRMKMTNPKMTESSLEVLGEDGVMISEYLSIRARHSILSTWLEQDYDHETGRIYGDCFVIGTPTFRARHTIIANIPSSEATYGPEIRELFTTIPGYKVVGADSSGNQARALCHYLDNEEYTRQVIEGDIHTVNRIALEALIGSLGDDARGKAKRFLYAILFGAGFGKLGLILTGKRDVAAGKKVKAGFLEAIPGLSKLSRWLNAWFTRTEERGRPYIQGLDTRFVYTESEHKALNYLLQSAEKITCSAAILWFLEAAREHELDWQPLIFYHDEIEFLVREDQAELAAELAQQAFREGPKLVGVTIMDGEAKIGNNWRDVH